jgi:hypothetical protein
MLQMIDLEKDILKAKKEYGNLQKEMGIVSTEKKTAVDSDFWKNIAEFVFLSVQGKNHMLGKIIELEREFASIRKEVQVLKADNSKEKGFDASVGSEEGTSLNEDSFDFKIEYLEYHIVCNIYFSSRWFVYTCFECIK